MRAANSKSEILKGRIERVYFAGSTFSAGRVQTSSGSVPFAGKFYAQEGSHMVLRGAWASHPKYGCSIAIAHKAHTFIQVTRAKETCIILGDAWGIRHCAAHQQVDKRRTNLSYFLAEATCP